MNSVKQITRPNEGLRHYCHKFLSRNLACKVVAEKERFDHWWEIVKVEFRDRWYGIEVYERDEQGNRTKKKYSR